MCENTHGQHGWNFSEDPDRAPRQSSPTIVIGDDDATESDESVDVRHLRETPEYSGGE